jgi:Uma2 family endonuclease
MSAIPRIPAHGGGYAGLRMSAEEFFGLGETQERYELIDGVVVMSPSPLPLHNAMIAEVIFQLMTFARRVAGVSVFPETDVRLAPALVYRPDIVAYAPGRLLGTPDRLTIAPDLVVEMLSPGTKAIDLVTKRDDYEAFGVGEYWAIDPADARVRAWRRQDERLIEAAVVGESVPSAALPGLVLDVRPLRELARSTRG